MQILDYVVLAVYFVGMTAIGLICMRRIKGQEDYFMGGRGFGKLMQTFAAFGAGTGSSDPVNTARTTYTSGMSGMWSVMTWLFVTPFYWIAAVWYRRMRHLTLGDWFVERYESKALGAAYTLFGILFYIVYGSMLLTGISKVVAPLIDTTTFAIGGSEVPIEYVFVPLIGLVVLLYGITGGLQAAYWTDLIQGLCIILLSIILIPAGLSALVQKFGDPQVDSMMDGMRIMHERLPGEFFTVIGSGAGSEFPLHRIVAVVIILLVGIVVQPHFIATGGGSAKSESSARIGLVTGNFLKRFCTVGWTLTGLIALALLADHAALADDPDKAWGIASRELLAPLGFGLLGLMLACLLAALMSSVDAYMVVSSALVVRNVYATYINPEAGEKECINLARVTGVAVIAGAVIISLMMNDVFGQLQLTWIFPTLFAALFWVGMYWRRATPAAAWITFAFSALVFFVLPALVPRVWSDFGQSPNSLATNTLIETRRTREAALSDVARSEAAITLWEQKSEQVEGLEDPMQRAAAIEALGTRPEPRRLGDPLVEIKRTGGKAIFWSGGVHPIDEQGEVRSDFPPRPIGPPEVVDARTTRQVYGYDETVQLRGFGNFRFDFLVYPLLYRAAGSDVADQPDAVLSTLELPVKIVAPFVVMILASLVTPKNSRAALDRYYVKMKTPVDPDPEEDRRQLELSYENPARFDHRKLFPNSQLEIQKPTPVDLVGFVVCVVICFAIIGMAIVVVNLGGS